MPSNRRGFIGIFSQNNEPDNDLDADSGESKTDELSSSNSAETDAVSKSDSAIEQDTADSDWDDIFGDSPPMEIEPPDPMTINPVAAASMTPIAAEPTVDKPDTKSEIPDQASITTDISTPMQGTETNAKSDKTSSAEGAHHTPNYTPMHHAPSTKSMLSKTDRQAVADAIQTLREKLSFTRQANNDQRESLIKLGQTGRGFVDQAMKVVTETPDILPRSFDDESFVTDVELIEALRLIGEDLRDLNRRVEDTESKIASSAFAGALVVHRCGTADSDKSHSEAYRRTSNGTAQPVGANNVAVNGTGV